MQVGEDDRILVIPEEPRPAMKEGCAEHKGTIRPRAEHNAAPTARPGWNRPSTAGRWGQRRGGLQPLRWWLARERWRRGLLSATLAETVQ